MLLASDLNRLRHMLEAGEEAIFYTRGLSKREFESQRVIQHAVVRCIELLGEAASRVSNETRAVHDEAPWISIIGMRNRLIHAYFDIDLNLVWQTTVLELPPLIDTLHAILDKARPEQ